MLIALEKISAEESVLQLVNGTSLEHLQAFLEDPRRATVTKIISIPGIYRVLEKESDLSRFIPILEWIRDRATSVLDALIVEETLEAAGASQIGASEHDNDWKSVGGFCSVADLADSKVSIIADRVFL